MTIITPIVCVLGILLGAALTLTPSLKEQRDKQDRLVCASRIIQHHAIAGAIIYMASLFGLIMLTIARSW